MAIRKDRGRFLVEFQQRGKRVFRRCPPGVTKAQAQELETKLRRERFDRDDLGHQEDLSLQGAIGLWLQDNRRKNQRQAASEAKQWEPFLKGKLLKDAPEVAQEAAKQWTQLRAVSPAGRSDSRGTGTSIGAPSRTRSGASKASTVNRRLMMLKAVCKAMWRRKLIGENLSARIETLREPKGKERFLTRREVSALAAKSPSAASRNAIWLLAYSGLRASELLAISPKDLQRGTLLVRTSKSGMPRSVPLPTVALPHLRALPLGLSYWQLRKEFLRARKAAGIGKEVTLHTLRHTYASWFLQQGGDLYTLSKLLGHSTIYVTTRYGHLATEHLKKAVAGLK